MHRFFKRLVFIFSIIFCWNIFLFTFSIADDAAAKTTNNAKTTSNVQAQAKKQKQDKSKQQQDTAEKVKWIQKFWQALYTVTWPLILIAWTFMDNNVVYGSFIWMDSLLWKVWNVMRSFANYIIWFILIFSIFSLFLWWKLEQFNPIKMIPQLAIASILVNASWFLIAAMIDVSNVMTYAVWTLPLQMAKKDIVKNQIVPKFWIKLQDDSENSFKIWVMDGKKTLPFCEYTPSKDWKLMAKSDCVFESKWKYYKYSSWDTIDPSKPTNAIKSWNTFWDIQKKLWWMVWILWTMYASLINIWKTASYPSWSWVAMTWDVIFKFAFLLALIIPLFTLAIILIVRTVLLWMFIVISPIIFLFTPIKNFEKVLWEKWKLTSLVSLIFLPVVVVFALSLSFVFLSYLKFQKHAINDTFWVKFKWKQVIIPLDWKDGKHNITIGYKWDDSASPFSNIWAAFSWFIESIFAIGFMWIIVFSALKTSKLTSWIASSINKFSISMAKAAPIVPIAGGQSISSLWQWISQIKQLPWQRQSEQYTKNLDPLLKELEGRMSWAESNAKKNANTSIPTASVGGWVSTSDFASSASANWSTESSLKDKTVSDVLSNSEDLSTLAKELGVNKTALKISLWKFNPTTKISDVKSADLKKYFKASTQADVKKIINDHVLTKNITLLQIDNGSKTKIIELFKQVWAGTVSTIWINKESVKALKTLWFTKNEVIKLLSDNLVSSKASMSSTDQENVNSRYK